jgi:hypothetical protein
MISGESAVDDLVRVEVTLMSFVLRFEVDGDGLLPEDFRVAEADFDVPATFLVE